MGEKTTRVIFFGASAVSEQAAIFCKQLGFHVVVLDNEPMKFEVPGFADCECIQTNFEDVKALDAIGISSDDMLCVITRGHTYDRQSFAYVLQTPAFYKGMMGSAKKNAKCFAYALEHGCTQEQIDAAYVPIGEKIGAIDAQEIGLSIAAQLVNVRNAHFPREKDHESLHAD